jgi:tetratricopeptide (TPR) repeat protein
MKPRRRRPALDRFFKRYLATADEIAFLQSVDRLYNVATLERLSATGGRMTRRAAVLALSHLGSYSSNAALGRALVDVDRGVRTLADTGIRWLWCRDGERDDCQALAALIALNVKQQYAEAVNLADELITLTPWYAECWNQRAIALFSLGRHAESIRDCQHTLELNPYHFGAATGMGQCFLELNDRLAALETFRRALSLFPDLEGVRAQVQFLQRELKR